MVGQPWTSQTFAFSATRAPSVAELEAHRPRTPIRDLFLSGSDVATVGVIGAMMGGLLCAASAEPIGALRYLRNS